MASPNAFVAGATGYVGREVVAELTRRGVDVVAHVRPQSSRLDHWKSTFSAMGAALDSAPWELDALTESLREHKPSLVFSLIGTTRHRAKSERVEGDPYEIIDYGLTEMLFRATEAARPEAVFVYLSAAGVSEKSSSAYMRARWKAEKLIGEGPMPYVLARPAIITGPDRDDSRPGERFGGVVLDGALSVLGALGARKLRSRYRSTTNTTLAKALVRHALTEPPPRRVAEGDELRCAVNDKS